MKAALNKPSIQIRASRARVSRIQTTGDIVLGPLAVAATKRIIVESADWSEAEVWAKQDEIARPVATSADAREGATAFAQKRAPVWQGR